MKTIGFIGGGRITGIFLHAYRNENFKPGQILVSDTNADVLKKLIQKYPDIVIENDLHALASHSDVLFLALHPPVMMEVLSVIRQSIKKDAIVVSLAPKITSAKMSDALGGFQSIARVNPSATSVINMGLNPVCFAPGMSDADQKVLLQLLKPLGNVPVVAEHKIEAYAIISAMGSTYFWFQMNHLKELALKYGMDEKEAESVIAEMIKATADTLFSSGLTPAEVFDLVPVKPIGEYEDSIKTYYSSKLDAVFEKIKP